jgi:hypothetical protein
MLMLGAVAGAVPASASNASTMPCSATKGHALTEQGGPVVALASVYLVYWGTYWGTSGGIKVRTYLDNLFKGVGKSTWARTLTQYCAGGYPPLVGLNGANELAGTATDLADPAGLPHMSQIKAKLQALAPTYQYGKKYPVGLPIPVMVLPPNHQAAFDYQNQSCGFHNWMSYTRTGPDGSETDYQPYMVADFGAVWDLSKDCQYGLNGPLGALSIVAGHEWAEAVTNPFPNSGTFPGVGWVNTAQRDEIGDMCAPVRVDPAGVQPYVNAFTLTLPTGSFRMQELYSNEANSGHGACVKGS